MKNLFILCIISIGLVLEFSCSEPPRSPIVVNKFSDKKFKEELRDKKCYLRFNKRDNGTLESDYYIYNDSSIIKVSYDTRNIPVSVSKYDKNSELMWEEEYYSNGQLLSRQGFIKGHPNGEYNKYYKDGRVSETGNYDMGFNTITIKYDELGRALDTVRNFKSSEVDKYMKYKKMENQRLQQEKEKQESGSN